MTSHSLVGPTKVKCSSTTLQAAWKPALGHKLAKSLLGAVPARKQVIVVVLDEVVDLDVMPVQLPGGRSLRRVSASALNEMVSKQEQPLCRLGFYDVCMRAPGGRAWGGVHNLIVKLCPLHGRRTDLHQYD